MTDRLELSEGDINNTPTRRQWRASLGKAACAALDADERFFLRQSLSTPCLTEIVRAEGPWLEDIEGRRILDFHGNSVHQLGHGHPKIVEAIRHTMDTLPFCPRRYSNAPATALAQRLVESTPDGLNKVLFAPSGSAAISMALKLARYATGRHKVLSFWDAFHGANIDAIGVGGEAVFRRGLGPLLPGAEHLPPFDLVRRFFGAERPFDRLADWIDYLLAIQGDVSALIAEPLRWTTVTAPPADFWPKVAQSCKQHGALLIFDEIACGLGRSGALWACQRLGATPDILVAGKGLGGGIMPLAAIIAAERLDCVPNTALGHYTHEKSPVACSAGLAVLEIIQAEGLVERAAELGRHGLSRLTEMQKKHRRIADVRGFGCHFGVEIGGEEPAAFADRLLYGCLENGLSFKIGGGTVATLCSPLTIALDAFDSAFDILDNTLSELGG
jgi:4-aminobutyrate aminotransferase